MKLTVTIPIEEVKAMIASAISDNHGVQVDVGSITFVLGGYQDTVVEVTAEVERARDFQA